jgi:Pyruvate/2-oxoacid:ferredoxin oxidoreductase gamma subunit
MNETRRKSAITELVEVFKRNAKYLTRNKKSFASIFGNAIFISLIMLSVFFQVCKFPSSLKEDYDRKDFKQLKQDIDKYYHNLIGITLMMSNQLTFSASINVVI